MDEPINPILEPFLQLVQYSTNFVITHITSTGFAFETKRPLTIEESDYHAGEKAHYSVGLEDISHRETIVYCLCDNSGDEQQLNGLKDLINYINPSTTWKRP